MPVGGEGRIGSEGGAGEGRGQSKGSNEKERDGSGSTGKGEEGRGVAEEEGDELEEEEMGGGEDVLEKELGGGAADDALEEEEAAGGMLANAGKRSFLALAGNAERASMPAQHVGEQVTVPGGKEDVQSPHISASSGKYLPWLTSSLTPWPMACESLLLHLSSLAAVHSWRAMDAADWEVLGGRLRKVLGNAAESLEGTVEGMEDDLHAALAGGGRSSKATADVSAVVRGRLSAAGGPVLLSSLELHCVLIAVQIQIKGLQEESSPASPPSQQSATSAAQNELEALLTRCAGESLRLFLATGMLIGLPLSFIHSRLQSQPSGKASGDEGRLLLVLQQWWAGSQSLLSALSRTCLAVPGRAAEAAVRAAEIWGAGGGPIRSLFTLLHASSVLLSSSGGPPCGALAGKESEGRGMDRSNLPAESSHTPVVTTTSLGDRASDRSCSVQLAAFWLLTRDNTLPQAVAAELTSASASAGGRRVQWGARASSAA